MTTNGKNEENTSSLFHSPSIFLVCPRAREKQMVNTKDKSLIWEVHINEGTYRRPIWIGKKGMTWFDEVDKIFSIHKVIRERYNFLRYKTLKLLYSRVDLMYN